MPQPRMHPSHAARQAAYRMRQEQARQKELRNRGLPALPAIATLPGHARWSQAISQANYLLTMVVAEMQDYYDDRSDNWQESERGEEHQERIGSVEAVLDALSELIP